MCVPRNLKGEILSLFDPCINALGQWPYCPSRMEVSYCTFGFGAIIRRDLRTLSRWLKCMRELNLHRIGNSRLTKLFGGLRYENIRRYNNLSLYMTARWPPQQISQLNFLGMSLPQRLLAEEDLVYLFPKSVIKRGFFEFVKSESICEKLMFLPITQVIDCSVLTFKPEISFCIYVTYKCD